MYRLFYRQVIPVLLRFQRLRENMGVFREIQWKVDSLVLPCASPNHVSIREGDGERCVGCDDLVSAGDLEYRITLPGGRGLSFHGGCFGFWEAEMLRRGWLRQPVTRKHLE